MLLMSAFKFVEVKVEADLGNIGNWRFFLIKWHYLNRTNWILIKIN